MSSVFGLMYENILKYWAISGGIFETRGNKTIKRGQYIVQENASLQRSV